MNCEYCGTPLDEGMVFCTQCGAAQTPPPPPEPEPDFSAPTTVLTPDMAPPAPQPVRPPEPVSQPKSQPKPEKQPKPAKKKKPMHPALAALLKIATVLLCLILSVSLLATMLVLDLRQLTSKSGLTKVVEDLLCEQSAVGVSRVNAAPGAAGVDISMPEGTDSESLVAWFYEAMKNQYGANMKVTQEQMQTFIDQSTAKDYVSEKVASYINDFVNGTSETAVPTDEILDLLDENLDLAEEVFDVKVDRALRDQVKTFLEKNDINEMVRTQVIEQVENIEIPGATPLLGSLTDHTGGTYTVADLMAELRVITSSGALTILIVLDLLLVVLLLLTNRLRFGPMLVSAGVPTLVVGILMSLPVALIQLLPLLLGNSLGIAAIALDLIVAVVGRIAPIHYGAAILGLLLIIIGGVITPSKKKRAAIS